MPLQTDQSGTPSPLFGERFPYPLDGKSLVLELAEAFAREFNATAREELAQHGPERVSQWIDLTVTTAFPTVVQQMPRIAIVRRSQSMELVGIGAEIESHIAPNGVGVRVFRGHKVQDTLDVSVCAINERLRDDLFLWFQQYLLDGINWLLPQLSTVYDLRCISATDDQVEFQGSATQPGFQFYVGQITVVAGYDRVILDNADILRSIINWQSIGSIVQRNTILAGVQP